MKFETQNKEEQTLGAFRMHRVLASTFTFGALEDMTVPIKSETSDWGEVEVLAKNFEVFQEEEIHIDTVVQGTTVSIHLINAFGHKSTCDVIHHRKGIKINANRISLALIGEWEMVIPQYRGPRLEEGATELPPNAELIPLKVIVG